MKIIKSIFSLIVIFGLCWHVWSKLQGNQLDKAELSRLAAEINDVFPVHAASVKAQPLFDSKGAVGKVQADKTVYLISDTQGKVKKLLKRKGNYVKKGEIIAEIESNSLEDQLRLTEANLQKLQADKARINALLEGDAITKRQLEEVDLGIKNAETQIALLKENINNTNLKSPISGIINILLIEEGSFVAGGMQVAEIVDGNRWKMLARVPEELVVDLRKGQEVKVRLDVFPEEILKGTINLIAVKADFGGKYQVEVYLENDKKLGIKGGMFGSILFSNGGTDSKVIPRKALVGSIQDPKVYVIENEQVNLQAIKVGYSDSKVLEIVEGLNFDQKVVIDGQINLVDGATVEIIEK